MGTSQSHEVKQLLVEVKARPQAAGTLEARVQQELVDQLSVPECATTRIVPTGLSQVPPSCLRTGCCPLPRLASPDPRFEPLQA